MITRRWELITMEEIPDEWLTPVDNSFLLSVQHMIGIKKGGGGSRLCIVCALKTESRCLCLAFHFCSMECLRYAWPIHKVDCKTGPKPKISANVVITLPEFEVCIAYQQWLCTQLSENLIGVLIENRARWITTYGEDAMKRTCLSLALRGKPAPIFTRIMTPNPQMFPESHRTIDASTMHELPCEKSRAAHDVEVNIGGAIVTKSAIAVNIVDEEYL